ncbi:hypothetical protein [Escherichia coli]|uniref:hypothetical protein n=1 Tax=Escherichia coli TaxID=562 RepID=UPI0010ADA270|nr:hypothetical protein [Escherichia coli]TJM60864.1 hypothetical protein C9045_24445 [Escherichia coli]
MKHTLAFHVRDFSSFFSPNLKAKLLPNSDALKVSNHQKKTTAIIKNFYPNIQTKETAWGDSMGEG